MGYILFKTKRVLSFSLTIFPDFAIIVFDLLKEEGLIMGGSTGINIMGAIQLAKKMKPGSTIVTILCDYGTRYFSKIYNKKFLKSKKLPIPNWIK